MIRLVCRLPLVLLVCLFLPNPVLGEEEQVKTLPLEEAVAIALKQNPAISAAINSSRAAEAGVIGARSGRWFSLDAAMQGQRSFRLSPLASELGFSNRDSLTTTVTLTQPLSTGGKVDSLVAQARAGREASAANLRLARQQVAFQAREAYYGALLAAEAAAVAGEAKRSAEEHLRIARARFQEGASPRFDVLQAEAFVARTEQALIRANNGAEIAREALNTAMGLPAGRRFELVSPPLGQASAEALPDLLAEAEKKRPDLEYLRWQAQVLEASIASTRADRRPSFSFLASYTALSPETQFFIGGYDVFLVGRLNLLNGDRTEAEIAQATSGHRAALDAVEQLRQAVALGVRSSHLNIAAAAAALEAAQREVQQAAEAHRIAVLRYKEGMGTSVEILDAETQLSDARNRSSQARYDYNLALAQLDLAVGRDPALD
jgi:outer membrane protein TolC